MSDWANAWLELQCSMIKGVSRGVIALGAPDSETYRPVAFWPSPAASDSQELRDALDAAIKQRTLVTIQQNAATNAGSAAPLFIANPIEKQGKLVGAVAVAVDAPTAVQLEATIQLLKWGASWLKLLLEREHNQRSPNDTAQLGMVLSLIVMALEHEHFRAAATAIATELARLFECERVSVGFTSGKRVRVEALSHSAVFDKRSNLVQSIGRAMDEVVAEEDGILFETNTTEHACPAHEYLANGFGCEAIYSLPLNVRGVAVGALTLEWQGKRNLPAARLSLVREISALIGPILHLKRQQEMGPAGRLQSLWRRQAERLFGEGHALFKAVMAGTVAAVLLLSLIKGEYQVTAAATLEGSIQRAIVAPFDGYIATAQARAGDLVQAGDLLVTLEDKDLKLEQVKLLGQREQLEKEYRNALASHERSEVRVLSARMAQTDAQLDLLEQQLARTQLKAPIGGLVVKGDLSQSLGSPVERGLVLFEIAPLEEYRIILNVDERAIAEIREQQQGHLTLTAMPDETLSFSVARITPVSFQKHDGNTFRVEARLHDTSSHLRPGMEGSGKIVVERRRLIWIWTHTLVDWLRLMWWRW